MYFGICCGLKQFVVIVFIMLCVPAHTHAPITHHQHLNWWEWLMSFSQGCVLLVVYVFRHITYHNWMHCTCVIHCCIAYMYITLHTHNSWHVSNTYHHNVMSWLWHTCHKLHSYIVPVTTSHMAHARYAPWVTRPHTHQLDGASLVCIMTLGVAYTHATHICVLHVYTMLKFTHRYITLSHIPNTPSHITGDTMYKCN